MIDQSGSLDYFRKPVEKSESLGRRRGFDRTFPSRSDSNSFGIADRIKVDLVLWLPLRGRGQRVLRVITRRLKLAASASVILSGTTKLRSAEAAGGLLIFGIQIVESKLRCRQAGPSVMIPIKDNFMQ